MYKLQASSHKSQVSELKMAGEKIKQEIGVVIRFVQQKEENQFRDSLRSKSRADKQHFSRRTSPMCPTLYCHGTDRRPHKKGLQQTIRSVLLEGLTRND